MLRTYDIVFYRRLPNSYGHEFPVALVRYRIDECDGRTAALDRAVGRFQSQMKLSNWRQLAHDIEVHQVA